MELHALGQFPFEILKLLAPDAEAVQMACDLIIWAPARSVGYDPLSARLSEPAPSLRFAIQFLWLTLLPN